MDPETSPLVPTLEGQYTIKNLVLISSGIVIGAGARGGKPVADPSIAKLGEVKSEKEKQQRR